MQHDVLDDDLDEDGDANDADDNTNLFREELNASVYDGRENSVAVIHQARLSASPSLADAGASIAPDLSTLSRNGLS